VKKTKRRKVTPAIKDPYKQAWYEIEAALNPRGFKWDKLSDTQKARRLRDALARGTYSLEQVLKKGLGWKAEETEPVEPKTEDDFK